MTNFNAFPFAGGGTSSTILEDMGLAAGCYADTPKKQPRKAQDSPSTQQSPKDQGDAPKGKKGQP